MVIKQNRGREELSGRVEGVRDAYASPTQLSTGLTATRSSETNSATTKTLAMGAQGNTGRGKLTSFRSANLTRSGLVGCWRSFAVEYLVISGLQRL